MRALGRPVHPACYAGRPRRILTHASDIPRFFREFRGSQSTPVRSVVIVVDGGRASNATTEYTDWIVAHGESGDVQDFP